MKTGNNISTLIIKYLKGELSKKEREKLAGWLKKDVRNRALFKDLTNEDSINRKLRKYNNVTKEVVWGKTLQKISSEEHSSSARFTKRINPWYRIALAASFLLFLSVTTYLIHSERSSDTHIENGSEQITAERNKATLKLADGTTFALDEIKSGEIAELGGVRIRKTENGEIIYESPIGETSPNAVLRYNEITTPLGGQYKIILPDGTKVWLNAESSLTYPVQFAETERHVELRGEAYFEVAKQQTPNQQKVPFFVRTQTQTVEVLGTHFNINAYENEKNIKTTLVEGSVRVSINFPNGEIDRSKSVLLHPNQQSVIDAGQIHITSVDIESATGWKDGYYKFNSEELRDIMQKISRWYDIEVDFEGGTEHHRFGGKISRKENISKVLEIMQETGNIRFRVEHKNEANHNIRVYNFNCSMC